MIRPAMVVAATPSASEVRRELQAIAKILGRHFGIPRRRAADPLDELVQTILSQNTSDVNSGRAFRSLKRAFPSWLGVCRQPAFPVDTRELCRPQRPLCPQCPVRRRCVYARASAWSLPGRGHEVTRLATGRSSRT
jgi:endonuclease III